jgi:sugar phosphate isomerase/epimerase
LQALYICDECHIADASALCRTDGYGLEVQSFYDPEYIVREANALELHREALKEIPERTLHGPFGDLCPGSFDPMVREVARTRMEQAVTIAGQLGISRFVFHHGYVPGTSFPDRWLVRATAYWQDLLKNKPESLRIHLENHLENDPGMLSDVVDSINDVRLNLCLDIGHVHCCARQSIVKWIERLTHRIGYVHMHDNHGQTDEHLGLGEGTIPMVDVCAALEEYAPDAIWAIESEFRKVPESLDWLTSHGFI